MSPKDGNGGDNKRRIVSDGGSSSEYSGLYKCYLDFEHTVHPDDGSVIAHLNKEVLGTHAPDIDYLTAMLRFDGEFPDSRAEWHSNYTPIDRWVRAHILREARGLSIQGGAEYLEETPTTANAMGFWEEPGANHENADPPGYTQLRDIWEEEFDDRMRGCVEVLAEKLVEYARDQGLPAPDTTFVPETDVETESEEPDEDDPTVRELTIDKTGDVWEHIRPMVLEHWYLKRHHNWQVPEHQFFDAEAALAADSDDVFPESALGNYKAKGVIEDAHYPSTHRKELTRFSVEEIREMNRSVVEDLIREARREGELVGSMTLAIDETKGHPWTGHIERNEDGDNIEEWRLGYKNDNDERTQYYHKWASVQVVGFDIPIVLDSLPVHRGLTKGEIVNDLLDTATDLLDDIELVLMDAGFDSAAAKNQAERHDVLYLNRKSRESDDKNRMREMWSDDPSEREAVRIVEEEDRPGMPTRRTIYVPKLLTDDDDDEDDDEDGLAARTRQQLLEEFEETVVEDDADAPEFPEESPFDALLAEMKAEEEARREDQDDDEEFDASELYIAFETNHPLAAKRPGIGEDAISEREQEQAAARMARKYGSRWGIENGFKKRGHFLPRTASPDHTFRFFGYAFGTILYNAWRLVDILVKLSVEDDPEYTPLVTASRFQAVMEGMFGLSKPPPEAATA